MRLLLLCGLLILIPVPSQAQWIGMGIRIPNSSQDGVGGTIAAGGGIPNNAMTFNGNYMLFKGQYMTFSGTP